MCDIDNEYWDDYAFRFLDNVDEPLIRLNAVGKQGRGSKRYYWDNSNREQAFLFQYTLNGKGVLEIDGKKNVVSKGQAFFLKMPNAEKYYYDREVSSGSQWEFIYIILQGNGVVPYFEYAVEHRGKIMELSEYHPSISFLLNLHSQAKEEMIGSAFQADSQAFHFLCLLCDQKGDEDFLTSDLVLGAKEYLQKNFSKPITLEQAAHFLGVSQSHLSREFLKYTGENPIHYLTKIRLENSVKMLSDTNKNLEQISLQCGFSDSNYYSKVFKKYMKVTPSDFRKQMKNQGYNSVRI